MTLQTSNLRRAVTGTVASGAMAASLLAGFGVATAFAEPVESCTGADCHKTDPAATTADPDAPPVMTADQALSIIANEYDQGDGGGQLSMLIHDVLTLRALGFKPSNGNKIAITEALEQRPNQAPLIAALKDTLAYQRKLKAQMENSGGQQPGAGFGIGQAPPGIGPAVPPGVPVQPGQNPGVVLGVG
jgi:hypothetical protein